MFDFKLKYKLYVFPNNSPFSRNLLLNMNMQMDKYQLRHLT